jgi:hypothetical protein
MTLRAIADGSVALGKFFGQVTRERAKVRVVVVHRIIAVDDYVWAHVNILNLFNDNPDDTGIAAVDIYKMNARRQRNRTLGHLAVRRQPEKLGANDRAEHSARQPERNVLRGTSEMSKALADLMERNLFDVFGEVNSARRAATIV